MERVIVRNMHQLNTVLKGRYLYVQTPVPEDMASIQVSHKSAREYVNEIWDYNNSQGGTTIESMGHKYYYHYHLPELYVSDGIAYLSRNEDYDGEWMRGDDVELSDNPDSVNGEFQVDWSQNV